MAEDKQIQEILIKKPKEYYNVEQLTQLKDVSIPTRGHPFDHFMIETDIKVGDEKFKFSGLNYTGPNNIFTEYCNGKTMKNLKQFTTAKENKDKTLVEFIKEKFEVEVDTIDKNWGDKWRKVCELLNTDFKDTGDAAQASINIKAIQIDEGDVLHEINDVSTVFDQLKLGDFLQIMMIEKFPGAFDKKIGGDRDGNILKWLNKETTKLALTKALQDGTYLLTGDTIPAADKYELFRQSNKISGSTTKSKFDDGTDINDIADFVTLFNDVITWCYIDDSALQLQKRQNETVEGKLTIQSVERVHILLDYIENNMPDFVGLTEFTRADIEYLTGWLTTISTKLDANYEVVEGGKYADENQDIENVLIYNSNKVDKQGDNISLGDDENDGKEKPIVQKFKIKNSTDKEFYVIVSHQDGKNPLNKSRPADKPNDATNTKLEN